MVSSKFKSATAKANYPPWCKPPPDPPIIPPPPGAPNSLTAVGTWVDEDPDAFAHVSESFYLAPEILGQKYSGESGTAEPRLEMTVTRVPDTDLWDIELRIFDEWRHPESHEWTNILSSPTDPITLHPPVLVTHPLRDYQSVHVWG